MIAGSNVCWTVVCWIDCLFSYCSCQSTLSFILYFEVLKKNTNLHGFVKIVEDQHSYGNLLPANHRVREVQRYKERLEHFQLKTKSKKIQNIKTFKIKLRDYLHSNQSC